MPDKAIIHPLSIQSHNENRAWNEYIIRYFGLRLDKVAKSDYRAMVLWQGSTKLFDCYDFQIRTMTNAEMHKKLRKYLERYLEHLQKFHSLDNDINYNPPKPGN